MEKDRLVIQLFFKFNIYFLNFKQIKSKNGQPFVDDFNNRNVKIIILILIVYT